MSQANLIDKLCLEMDCKERTIEARLKTIITHKFQILDTAGAVKQLCKRQENREVIYYLSD